MQDELDPWIFCPDKKCWYCKKDIGKDAKLNGSYYTGCPYCHRSFVD